MVGVMGIWDGELLLSLPEEGEVDSTSIYDQEIEKIDGGALILIDLVPSESYLRKFLLERKLGTNSRSMICILSSRQLLDLFPTTEDLEELYRSGNLKVWSESSWEISLELECSKVRSPFLFCQSVRGREGHPLLDQVYTKIKGYRRDFVKRAQDARKTIKAYADSEELQQRLSLWAKGELKPKVYVDRTCSSIAVKRFSDGVAKGLKDLGCQVMIHTPCQGGEVDYTLSTNIEIAEFKPDLVIRSPNSYKDPKNLKINPGLPTLYSLQDNIPHILHARHVLEEPIGPYDSINVLLAQYLEGYVAGGIPPKQLMHAYLPSEDPVKEVDFESIDEIYDISFVKTMGNSMDLAPCIGAEDPYGDYSRIQSLIEETLDKEELISLPECATLVSPDKMEGALSYYHQQFCIRYIQALAKRDFSMALTGANWERYPECAPFAKGHAEDFIAYQRSFRESRINLSLNPWGMYHPRIVQGGRCGAFFMVHRVPEHLLWLPMPEELVEGEHYVAFSTQEEMLEKCAYYLAHQEERRAIAKNLQSCVEKYFTYPQFCKKLLKHYQDLLLPQ